MQRLLDLLGMAAMTVAIILIGAHTSVNAQGWTGCYVGVQAGYGATHHDVSLDVVTGGPSGSLLDVPLSSQGGQIGLHGGCDIQVQKLVVGAFADYNWLSQSLEITSPLGGAFFPGLNPIAKLDLDTMWTVGGRAGLLVGASNSTLVYGLVGYSKMDVSDLQLLGTLGGSFAVPSLEGWTFGGGIAVDLGSNIRLGAEYRWTRFDKIDIPLFAAGGNSISIGSQPEMHTAMARLSYMIPVALGAK